MDKYTIYCTAEQTKKALELGAPIERGHESSRYFNIGVPTYYDENDEICRVKNSVIYIPTAEQMIGFLRENRLFIEIMMNDTNAPRHFDGFIFINTTDEALCCPEPKETFEEATLAAIDAALDYLSKK